MTYQICRNADPRIRTVCTVRTTIARAAWYDLAKENPLFETITAQNPRWNATLNRATEIAKALFDAKISARPRIYADENRLGGSMIPETLEQDNSDLPGWATENWDGTTTLVTMRVPNDLPIDVSIFVVEGGSDNFCNVAQIDADMRNQGKTLAQAVNVSPSQN